jgi:hypothetical protein
MAVLRACDADGVQRSLFPTTRKSDSELPGLTRGVPPEFHHLVTKRLRTAQLPLPGSGPREIAAIKQAIAHDIAPFDALHIVGTLMVTSMALDATADVEPAATTEYVASILLERDDQARLAPQLAEPERNHAVQRTLDRVRGLTLFGLDAGRRASDRASTPLNAIAEALKASDIVNRWPGYEPQVTAFLGELFSEEHTSEFLINTLGFNGEHALACEAAIRQLLGRRLAEWRDHVPEAISAAEELWDAGEAEVPAGLELTKGTSREQRFWWLVMQYFTSEKLIDVLAFDTAEVAEWASVPEPVAAAFVDHFTCPWGVARGLTLLRGRSEIRRRPLIRHSDGRAFPTSVGNVLWAIRPTVEDALQHDDAAFEAYQQRRSAITETRAASAFQEALAPDLLLKNVDFAMPDDNGETDVLVRIDDVLLVVEAKSGVLSDAAYGGRKSALTKDLRKLLGKSAAQTSKLRRALDDEQSVSFVDRATRGQIAVDLDGVERVFTVVVTLEDLTSVAMRPQRLQDAGIINTCDEMPWCVSLFDLEAIAGSTQFPGQLTSYIEARSHIDPRAEWPGEDDLWMTHLLARLRFGHIEADRFMVDGQTDLLAAQWMHGGRAPRADLPKATKKSIRRLSRTRPSGWLHQTEQLLDAALRHREPRLRAPVLA